MDKMEIKLNLAQRNYGRGVLREEQARENNAKEESKVSRITGRESKGREQRSPK